MRGFLILLFLLWNIQTHAISEPYFCPEGIPLELKAKGFDLNAPTGVNTAPFDMNAYVNNKFQQQKDKYSKSQDVMTIQNELDQVFKPAFDVQKLGNEYSKMLIKNPKSKQLPKLKAKLLKNLGALEASDLQCYVESGDLATACSYLDCPKVFLLNSLFNVAEMFKDKLLKTNLVFSSNCSSMAALREKARLAIEKEIAASRELLELPIKYFSDQKVFLGRSHNFFSKFGELASDTVKHIVNDKGDVAWVLLKSNAIQGALIIRKGPSGKQVINEFFQMNKACKVAVRTHSVDSAKDATSERNDFVVDSGSCKVILQNIDNRAAWAPFSSSYSINKVIAECREQGGQSFTAKDRYPVCRCPESGKEISPNWDTCLDSRFMSPSEKFRREVEKASDSTIPDYLIPRNRDAMIQACKEHFPITENPGKIPSDPGPSGSQR